MSTLKICQTEIDKEKKDILKILIVKEKNSEII